MKKKMNKAIASITAAAMFFSGAMFSPGMVMLSYADEAAEVPEVVQNTGKTEAPAQNETTNNPVEMSEQNETTNTRNLKESGETTKETTEEIKNEAEKNTTPADKADTETAPAGEAEKEITSQQQEEAVETEQGFGENLVVSWLESLGYQVNEEGTKILKGDNVVAEHGQDQTFTIHSGDLKLKTKGTYKGEVKVDGNADLTLAGASIEALASAAITIAAGVTTTITLEEGTENNVTGSNGYAGISVGWEKEKAADLTIEGEGSLEATGNGGGAGIGGSKNKNGGNSGTTGNVTINNGTITAVSNGGGAGIGTSDNPMNGTSSGSYKNVEDQWGTITINGGNIIARANGDGAGIGGGNHSDSGKIIINGGAIDTAGYTGIGNGVGSSKAGAENTKGPGYYFADIEINGGNVNAVGRDIGAGIGGGMYSDAIIKITGGDITAIGGSRQGKTHHGGAGIGGGYLGHGQIEITGGIIEAAGGDGAAGIGSGGSPNATKDRKTGGRVGETTIDQTDITISGGTVIATGGIQGGAGIGSGVGADKVNINISGGTILAKGAASTEEKMQGGAGIGSGFQGTGSGSSKYFADTDTTIAITGGNITAIGGWGASGIGSGAANKMADNIRIGEAANIEAYADGTKFAIDTRVLDEEGNTVSRTEGREITTPILQGTYVHAGQIGDYEQNPEGLKSIQIINDKTGEARTLTQMPEGYRSFAASVAEEGTYTVFTDDEGIGQGEGRYFSRTKKDVYNEEEVLERNVQYTVTANGLADNNYLYPVKTIVVSKIAEALNGSDLSGLNQTLTFALKQRSEDGEKTDDFFRKEDGSIWTETIEIIGGIPQQKAFFVNVEDRIYDVWEVILQEDGTIEALTAGGKYEGYILKEIATRHGDNGDNNAQIDENKWSDEIVVVNSYDEIRPEEPVQEPENAAPRKPAATPAEAITPADEPAEELEAFTDTDQGEAIEETAAPEAPEATQEEVIAPEPIEAEIVTPAQTVQNVVITKIPETAAAVMETVHTFQIIEEDETPMAAPVVEELGEEEVPLAGIEGHDEHSCCLLHLILMIGALATVALYTRRRKALGEEVDELKSELLSLAAEAGCIDRYMAQKGIAKEDINAEDVLEEVMKDEYMVQ